MSSYGADTTTDEVLDGIDLTGRRVVITGGSSGLGEESARALSAHGASVTLLARSVEKLEAAAGRIRARVPDAQLELGVVDLASFASIRACAAEQLARRPAIDILINNAGVMACPEGRTADGFETQFGTNHLGHFLLTAMLFDAVLAGDAPRVVNLSSAGHATADVDLDDVGFERTPYDAWTAYGRSKTANALFSRGLAQRYGDAGLLAFAVHPGGIMTDLGRHLDEDLINQMIANSAARAEAHGETGSFAFKSVEAGAATQVWACVAPLADHNGAYLADCQVGVAGGNPNTTGFEPYLLDDETTDRLWTLSEAWVGQSFPAVSG
jgi:NAD(P)-dependent dehydrogenase (short-subunit alcohol dehydrogenase family)